MDEAVNVSGIRFHGVARDLRTSPLPTAEIDRTGNVYVAWEDCRFRKQCASNDIVFSKSSDGVNWSEAARVPIDPVTSTADHFIPGLGVDPTTAGSSTHLALTYYFLSAGGLRHDELPARRRLHLLARRGRPLGRRDPARGTDDPRPDCSDLAGTDDRRLHLDLVLGRERRLSSSRSARPRPPVRRSTSPHTRPRRRWRWPRRRRRRTQQAPRARGR